MRRLLLACLASCGFLSKPGAATRPLIIEHVTVLPMTADGAALEDACVLIDEGRILTVGAAPEAVPRGTRRIDARGKFLMPGFTDMHTHVENDRLLRLWSANQSLPDGTVVLEDVLLPYLAHGVTQIFNLTAMAEAVGQSAAIESGQVLGPHIANAPMIDGSPPLWPPGMTRAAATPADGRQAVRDAAGDGFAFVKAYGMLSLETFTAIVDEARRHRMRVVGHIPQRGKNLTAQFFQPGFDLVAHAEEYAQQTQKPDFDAIPRYVEMAKRNGTWLVATLTLDERIVEQMRDPSTLRTRPEMRYLPPYEYHAVLNANSYMENRAQRAPLVQAIVDFNQALVRAFVAAGIPVLTGTDAPVPGTVPGFSLHDEFDALTRAGMTNTQVLEATTRRAAQWLGTIGDRGTVAAGKRADLVLLEADPRAQIANTRRIAAVILGGRYLDRAYLDRRMERLAARYRAR
jgi:imidazolonepropionase-like amidohydrolase